MDERTETTAQPGGEKQFCPHCGKALDKNAVFCDNCGTRIGDAIVRPQTPCKPPEDTSPLKTGEYFLLTFLYSLPLVGLILMIVWSFSDGNVNRKNLSRAYLIWQVIAIVLGVLLYAALFAIAGYMFTYGEVFEEFMYY